VADDRFGISVSGAGDVNGDGYADVIVGASGNDGGGADAGRAYVYYGGPGADAVADNTLTGATAGDFFGVSVSGAGDVNGDGYADVIVGAYANDTGGSQAGRAYVYYGGPGADAVADLTFTGAVADDNLGWSVSGAGDVNGDGYADVIVGAHLNDAGGLNAGRAYLYYGGPGADAVADLTLTGAVAGDFFGWSVSGAGDTNGDGYADVIVGALWNSAGGLSAGRAYVYYGGPGADTVADLTFTGVAASDNLGFSVSGAGDVNGDGHSDVIVGAYGNDTGGSIAGQAYVYYGGPGADPFADLTFTGQAGDLLGHSVSGAGDVNRDGYADVIVGADQNDAGGQQAGQAYVYYGGPGADTVADLTMTGVEMGDFFGISVSEAGDVNGDGYADVIVGADRNDAGGSEAGQAYVYTSRPFEVLSPNGGEQWVVGREHTVRWLGGDPADLWISLDGGAGYSLLASGVGGGPLNELGVIATAPATESARIRISATGEPVTHASSDLSDGVFSIVSPSVPPTAAQRLQLAPAGAVATDQLGFSVSTAGDVNGDGYDDVIVGAPQNDAGATDAGRAYVYYGGPTADEVADLTLTGAAAVDLFGVSVSAAGDMNKDGFDDVIVGAILNDAGGAEAGRAYVYYGGPAPDAVADLLLTGAAAGDQFGNSVSSAGDVNGDGYGDVIVAAYFNDAGGANAGRAYVFFGGPAPDAVADWTLTGAVAGDSFGRSVSGAGDVNGDGFGDVIVGAYFNDAGGTSAGRAYIFYGGPVPNAVADITFTGAAANDQFGISVSHAGDANGDGFSDVIVGAYLNDAGGADAGRAYLFYGGPGLDAEADLVFTGFVASDQLGISVAGAGDVNGDGYGDVVVGAHQNDVTGSNSGRAYVHYGGPGADALPDIALNGAAAGDLFGRSVSTAGDVNRDGFADVIVGAFTNDFTASDAGRAYVHDFNRYFVTAPNGGETWPVGATRTISWLGAEPADVWLSPDGGNSHQLVESGVGGAAQNLLTVRVPHTPTKFARIKLTPTDANIGGFDRSDSLFTIQTSVALLAMLAAPLPGGGASITWSTNPGPEDLAGYRLERSAAGTPDWRILVELTRDTFATDPQGGPGIQYRLFAVNGFGEELWLGEASIRPVAPLVAWPLPYRGGNLAISFATYGGLGGGLGPAEVAVYDVSGRLVRQIARGSYAAGHQVVGWDGKDERGRKVSSGIYFLRAKSAGAERTFKLAVAR
jgi:hypothetical protein